MGKDLQKTIQVLSPSPQYTFLSLLCCVSYVFILFGIVADRYWYENANKDHQRKITSFSYETNLDFGFLLKSNRFSISFSLPVKNSFRRTGPLLQIFCILICLNETLVLFSLDSNSQLGINVLVFEILEEILLVQFPS